MKSGCHIKKLISNDYIRYSLCMLLIVVFMFLTAAYFTWKSCLEDSLKKAELANQEIQRTIQRTLEDVEKIYQGIGNTISEEGSGKDLGTIVCSLKEIAQHSSSHLSYYSWTCLDWVNPDQFMVANSFQGVLTNPVKVKERKFLVEGPQKPWNLIVCKPDRGYSSGLWVIPVGMGVMDQNNQFMGILSGGLNVEQFTHKIRSDLSYNDVSFLVTDDQNEAIFYSPDISKEKVGGIASFLFDKFDSLIIDYRSTQNPIYKDHLAFFTYTKLQKYTYDIFVGFNSSLIYINFYSKLLPWLLSFICFGISSLCFVFLFMKQKLRPFVNLIDSAVEVAKGNGVIQIDSSCDGEPKRLAHTIEQISYLIEERQKNFSLLTAIYEQQKVSFEELKEKHFELQEKHRLLNNTLDVIKDSEICRDAFTQKVNHELENAALGIYYVTHILINNLKGEFDVPLDKNTELQKLNQILDNIQVLNNLNDRRLTLGEEDAPTLIEEAILIHKKTALFRNIEIKLSYAEDLPTILLDELKFKQIIVGILAYVIFQSPDNGVIDVVLDSCFLSGENHLEILIKDKGFGLTHEDMERIESKFGFEWGQFANLTVLKVKEIDALIQLHQGKMHINSKWQEGTSIQILIPFDLVNRKELPPKSIQLQPEKLIEKEKIVNIESVMEVS